jgi:hypothetical protein
VELQALVHDLGAELADEDLRHADDLHGVEGERLLLHVALLVVHVRGLVRERARGLELRMQVDELVLPVLALDDRLAERLALAAVLDCLIHRELEPGARADARDEALRLEVLHQVHEALVGLAEHVSLRHAHVLERELRGVARVVADLLQLLRHAETLRLRRDEEEAAAVRPGLRVRLHEERHEVRARAVRDVRLRAVDDPVVAVLLRPRLDARDVAARVGLADAERDDLLAPERRLQELFDLFLGAEVADDRSRHVALHEEAHRHARGEASRQLLRLRDGEPVVTARAAVLFGVVRAEDAELARSLEHLVGEELGLLPLVGVRSELLRRELANGVAEVVVLLAKRAGHAILRTRNIADCKTRRLARPT